MRYSNEFGFYELNQFPGCNQIVVSNHAHIYKSFRGKGYGKNQHKERLETIKSLGYDYVICSVNSENFTEIHILETNDWKVLDEFLNKETGNKVKIYGKIVGNNSGELC